MARLVIQSGDGEIQEFELEGELRLGRGDDNDIVLPQGGVSRNHARFFRKNGIVWVEDLGSSNGVFVDNQPIEAPSELSDESQVTIGDYKVSVKGAARPKKRPAPGANMVRSGGYIDHATRHLPPRDQKKKATPRRAVDGSKSSTKEPLLRGQNRDVEGKEFVISLPKTVVGRSSQCDIVVNEDSVSRQHTELRRRGERVWAKDLGSSNGLCLNGQPLKGEVELHSGDVLLLGEVEFVFENSSGKALGRPVASSGAAKNEPRKAAVKKPVSPALIKGLITFVCFLLAVALVWVMLNKHVIRALDQKFSSTGNSGGIGTPVATKEPSLEESLSTCREKASTDVGEPNWNAALTACDRVLAQEPVHPEANELKRRILKESECQKHADDGLAAAQRDLSDDAWGHFEKIRPECSYAYFHYKSKVRAEAERLSVRAGNDCRTYSNHDQWDAAAKSCTEYMKFACQEMQDDQLLPPVGKKLSLFGSVGRKEWRPTDAMYLTMLKARSQAKVAGLPWKCPRIDILRADHHPEAATPSIAVNFTDSYKSKDLAEVAEAYYSGKYTEADRLVQKIRSDVAKVEWHEAADILKGTMADAEAAYKRGTAALGAERTEEAAEEFKRALDRDAHVVLGEKYPEDPATLKSLLDARRSVLRSNAQNEFSQGAYKAGAEMAKRSDALRACGYWKLGASIYRGNIQLLRALTDVCTAEAQQRFKHAEDCASLKEVMAFAVDGDGFAEQAKAKMQSLKCAQN